MEAEGSSSVWEPANAPQVIASMAAMYHLVLRADSDVYSDLSEYLGYLSSKNPSLHTRSLATYDKDDTGQCILLYRVSPGVWTIEENGVTFQYMLCRRIDQVVKGKRGPPDFYQEFHIATEHSFEALEAIVYAARKHCNPSSSRDRIVCKRYTGSYWNLFSKQIKRNIQTLFLPEATQQSIVEDVRAFLCSEKEYCNFGMPYKRVYMLSGKAGTGKTSLVYALASHFDLNLYVFGFDQGLDDGSFNHAVSGLDDRALLLLEDVDQGVSRDKVSLSAITNVLDGICFKSRMLVFMTTNHLEDLDPVLLRSGRVDRHIKFDYATADQISAMLRYNHFPKDAVDVERLQRVTRRLVARRITTAALSQFLFQHRHVGDILAQLEEDFESLLERVHGEPVSYIL